MEEKEDQLGFFFQILYCRVNCVPPATIQCKISDFCLCYIFLVFYVKFHWEIVDSSSILIMGKVLLRCPHFMGGGEGGWRDLFCFF